MTQYITILLLFFNLVTFSQNKKSLTLDNLELIKVNGGQFVMGNGTINNQDIIKSGPPHKVILSSYYISNYEITFSQFKKFINSSNYITDAEKDGESLLWDSQKFVVKKGVSWKCNEFGTLQTNDNMPVIYVSQKDAIAFCNWLSIFENKVFRLPTEAEWEYAAGGGSSNYRSLFGNGTNLLNSTEANFNSFNKNKYSLKGEFPDKLTVVGNYIPNKLGIFDMAGNVKEWCNDYFDSEYYSNSPVTNPTGPVKGYFKIYRGGSWLDISDNCLITTRLYFPASYSSPDIGFRVVLED